MAEPSVGTIAPGVNATLPGEVKNQKYWTISGIHSSSVQVLTVTTTITEVSAPQYLLNARTGEIIYAEGISGATFTSCTRGADGTTAIAMANGDRIYLVNSANIYNQLRREILRIDSYLVTNGDTHDHSGGDGAQISHAGLSDLTTGDPHTQYQKESEKGAASGYASLNASTKVVEDPANATATPTASKIPIADGSGKLDGWISATATPTASKIPIANASGKLDSWISSNITEWTAIADSWSYASATTITVPSGASSLYSVGTKLRLKQGGSYKYFYIVTVADTLLTVTGGSDYSMAEAAITDIYVSIASNPIAFPIWFNYTPSLTNMAGGTINIAQFCLIAQTCFVRIQYTFAGADISGAVSISTPVTGTTPFTSDVIGKASLRDAGTALYEGVVILTTTTAMSPRALKADATYLTYIDLSSTVPHTWAVNDNIMFEVWYKIA